MRVDKREGSSGDIPIEVISTYGTDLRLAEIQSLRLRESETQSLQLRESENQSLRQTRIFSLPLPQTLNLRLAQPPRVADMFPQQTQILRLL
jgi:hypothetical protein